MLFRVHALNEARKFARSPAARSSVASSSKWGTSRMGTEKSRQRLFRFTRSRHGRNALNGRQVISALPRTHAEYSPIPSKGTNQSIDQSLAE
jgi:ribosomal protein L4